MCGCIIVVNKWDLIEKDSKIMKKFEIEICEMFKFLFYVLIVFVFVKEN